MTDAGVQVFTRSGSDHTLVSRTGFFSVFFLKVVFDQNVNGHTTVSQTGFFIPFLTWDVSDHTTGPVCETGAWSLTSQSKL